MELAQICAFTPTVAAPHEDTRFTFQLDFDSEFVWPDVDFDTSETIARYPMDERTSIRQLLLEASATLLRISAPAHAFINLHLEIVVVRRRHPFLLASSSSNRLQAGTCLLTNIHGASPQPYIAIEYLLHESIHQSLYHDERRKGALLKLGSPERMRSPWTGNSIPAHSLVHACFVWWGLLHLWQCLLERSDTHIERLIALDGMSRSLFGFHFVPDIIEGRVLGSQQLRPGVARTILTLSARCIELSAILPTQESILDQLQRARHDSLRRTPLHPFLERPPPVDNQ